MFLGSRKRPGQTPVSELIRRMGVGIRRLRRMFRSKFEQADA
jgi:lipopolysaccharide export system permease protein